MKHRILRPQILHPNTSLVLISRTSCRRNVHSSKRQQSSASHARSLNPAIIPSGASPPGTKATSRDSPLAIFPTTAVIRTYLITSLSSSPFLLGLSVNFVRRMARSNSVFLGLEKNPLLRWALKKTFYAQFCAGENSCEVQKTVDLVKSRGFTGVMLEYALEVLKSDGASSVKTEDEIEIWRRGMLETVGIATPGDFVGLKWTGLGAEALQLLNANRPPTPAMLSAVYEVCDLAAEKDVAILPAAELSHTNAGLGKWTLDLQKRYNKIPGHPIMYTTYQAYLKSTPQRLAADLEIAREEGFTLGVKLVRGAYLASEPKSEVCSSKEETDWQFDALMEAVLHRRYNDLLRPKAEKAEFPNVALMIASHNKLSVQKAIAIRKEQGQAERIECSFAQLQGMADEISSQLVQASKAAATEPGAADRLRAFKCATWGTMAECLNFLLRRAAENQDAAGRTADTRRAMAQELWRRWKTVFKLN